MTDVITPDDAMRARCADFFKRRAAVSERLHRTFAYNVSHWPERKSLTINLKTYADMGCYYELESVRRVVELGASDFWYDLRRVGWDVTYEVKRKLFGGYVVKVVIK